MKIRWIYLPFLIIVFFNQSVISAETEWTERKLGRLSLKAAQAAEHKKWSDAIKYGEQLLEAAKVLDKPNSPRYIKFLKDLNRYHDKAGRLKEVSSSIEEAYFLSKELLGVDHPTTKMSRTLYYKLHIANQNYIEAIPLVIENITVLKEENGDHHKHLQYLKQLYSLYGLSGKLAEEEEALIEYLNLSKLFYKISDEDNIKIIVNLANNYCRQGKMEKFNQLIERHKLEYYCE